MEEFRCDAVDLVRSSQRPINQVARELGMSHETLRRRLRWHLRIPSGPWSCTIDVDHRCWVTGADARRDVFRRIAFEGRLTPANH